MTLAKAKLCSRCPDFYVNLTDIFRLGGPGGGVMTTTFENLLCKAYVYIKINNHIASYS